MRNRRNSSNMALNVVCTVIFVIITFTFAISFISTTIITANACSITSTYCKFFITLQFLFQA